MENDTIRIPCDGFAISLRRDSFDILVGGSHFFTVSPISAVSTKNKADQDDADSLRLDIFYEDGAVIARWTSRSSLWERKEYLLRIEKALFHYSVRVYGNEIPHHIDYFCGCSFGRQAGDSV